MYKALFFLSIDITQLIEERGKDEATIEFEHQKFNPYFMEVLQISNNAQGLF